MKIQEYSDIILNFNFSITKVFSGNVLYFDNFKEKFEKVDKIKLFASYLKNKNFLNVLNKNLGLKLTEDSEFDSSCFSSIDISFLYDLRDCFVFEVSVSIEDKTSNNYISIDTSFIESPNVLFQTEYRSADINISQIKSVF